MSPPSPQKLTTVVGPWEQFGQNPSIRAEVATAADPPDFLDRLKQEQVLDIARERFRVAANAENRRREEMMVDMRFRCGQQWDEAIQRMRDAQGRPCLTINRIPGFLKHVLNSLRQNRPEIKVNPIGSGADEEMAEIIQGLIRHIILNSQGEQALDTAFENMCTMGLGFLRVVDDWADPRSFDKDLRVEWVPNTFSVYFDPGAAKPDWSDAKYCFIVEDISIAEFKQRFGDKSHFVSLNEFSSIGDHQPTWMPGGKIRIAEYFHLEEVEDTLYGFSDGSSLLLGDLNLGRGVTLAETAMEMIEDPTVGAVSASVIRLSNGEMRLPTDLGLAPDAMLVHQRVARVPRVIWTLMSGIEVLKERVWPGKYIPVIPMIGNQIELDGERILVGMVRFAREAQRMFNYMYSCFVEAIALVPKSPWVAEFDQISEFKDLWDNAHKTLQTVLLYKAKNVEGAMVPPPQRQQAEPPIAAFVEGLRLSDQNLKATFSIYDASLGERGPQESGRAINARKIESENATYDWVDNFNRCLMYLGRILQDLLPHYYNTPGRIVQITREDEQVQKVVLNEEHEDGGKLKKFDLAQGRYGIQLSTGPSYMTRRQESAAAMMELAKFWPALMQIAGPQMVRAMDWPGKEAIAAQLEKAQPPELRDTKDGEENAQLKAQELQTQLAQAAAMVQQLTAALQESSNEKSIAREKEMWATLRTQMQEENKAAIAQLNAGSREAQFMNEKLFAEMERMRAILEGALVPAAGPDGPQDSPARGSAPAAAHSSGAAASPPPATGSASPQMTPGGVGSAAS
jgi:hypothetical protein